MTLFSKRLDKRYKNFLRRAQNIETSARLSAQHDEEFKGNLHPYLRVPPKLFQYFSWCSF